MGENYIRVRRGNCPLWPHEALDPRLRAQDPLMNPLAIASENHIADASCGQMAESDTDIRMHLRGLSS
ncbi:hypothetical protein [Lentzea xinjiangensis]|uniref:hypothetical protein n=1 Tax=Lentzea xinjiangensis TaxID=402600 RepID=UPI0015A65976|nr:hypothetical protein [Lentzea xinjiangensis]